MQKHRGRTVTLFGLLMVLVSSLLAACGTPAPAAIDGAATASTTTASTQASAASTQASAAASERPAAVLTPPVVNGEQITITHIHGETTLTRNPQKVVVFDYSALDTLDQLGVPVAAVPQANVPPFLSKYAGAEYTNAGTLFEPDYEKVNELKPDLIIVGGRSSAVYPELAKIAPTIDVTVDQTQLVESFKHNVINLATIFGKENEATSRLAAIDEAISRVKSKAATSNANALIVLTTGGKVSAYGPGSRFGIIHDVLGVTPAVADVQAETHGDAISFEFIRDKNPDILYVVDRDSATGEGTASAEQVLDNELVKATNASQNGKMVYLDPTMWYLANAGLGTMAAMIAEVEASLS